MFKKMNLFSKTTLELLILFATRPSTKFYEREAAKEAKVSSASANGALSNLAKAGLLKHEPVGRMNFYKANLANPFLRQFKVLLNVDALEPVIKALTPYSSRMILYGSCSRGTNNEESDIDLFCQLLDAKYGKNADPAVDSAFKRIRHTSPKLNVMYSSSVGLEEMKRDNRPLYERIMGGINLWSRYDEQ